MSQSQESLAGGRVTRIDPAHPTRSNEPQELSGPPRELAMIAAGEVPAHVGEQLRVQASQLAGHLRNKQQQIDHREAELNARIAQLEREVRISRMLLAEREHGFVERERQLKQEAQEAQHETRAITVSNVAAQAELEQRRAELSEREADLDAREHRLCAGQMQLAQEAESLRVLKEQQEAFLAASVLLDEQTRTLQEERREFESQCDIAKAELRRERELFEERQQANEQSLAQLRDKLTVRQAAIEQRRASLEQMKQQVFELHRESIEMRMVAEQLWQHAAKGRPVAELTQSLGALRTKLADEFRVSRDELIEKEQQLRELAGKLNHRQQQLKQQRAELNQWLERRNAGIEEQAARLMSRELELDAQQQAIREREAAWREERHVMEARVRQLARQQRPPSPIAA